MQMALTLITKKNWLKGGDSYLQTAAEHREWTKIQSFQPTLWLSSTVEVD